MGISSAIGAIGAVEVPTGSVMPFAGINAPARWLLCSGQDISRTTYADLFSAITISFVGATTTNSNTTVSGLSGMSSTTHVGWGIAGNGIPSGATISSVTNSTTVVISANATSTQTGTASIAIGPYGFTGANNSTTFLIPDLRGRVIAGMDNMGGTSANRLTAPAATLNGIDGDFLGRTGGSETHTLTTAQMPSHTHNFYTWIGSYYGSAYTYGMNPYTGLTQPTSATGGDAAHNNVQPTIILNYIIRV